MEQPIIGYDQDELGDWRAILACGHRQHVRHNPPFVNRPWVLTEEGRRRFLGAPLDCVRCDDGEPVGDGMVSAAALEAAYARFAAELAGTIRRRVADEAADDAMRRALLAIADIPDDVPGPLEAWLAAQVQTILPRSAAEPAELAAAARAIVDCLPGLYRQAIILTDYRGLGERELAARIDLSPGDAAARLSAARRMLAEALRDCCHTLRESLAS